MLKRRGESASTCAVMSHEAHRIAVLHQRIFAGDAFVDGDQDFFLPQQLEHVTKPASLPLNNLPNCHRGGEFTCEVPLSIRSLKLSHQCDRNHVACALSVPCRAAWKWPRNLGD